MPRAAPCMIACTPSSLTPTLRWLSCARQRGGEELLQELLLLLLCRGRCWSRSVDLRLCSGWPTTLCLQRGTSSS